MSAIDPYEYDQTKLLLRSPGRVIPITPNDNGQLSRVCKALRVYNPTAAAVQVTLICRDESNSKPVTLDFPATCLWVESVIFNQVLLTGTSVGITLHGYTD